MYINKEKQITFRSTLLSVSFFFSQIEDISIIMKIYKFIGLLEVLEIGSFYHILNFFVRDIVPTFWTIKLVLFRSWPLI